MRGMILLHGTPFFISLLVSSTIDILQVRITFFANVGRVALITLTWFNYTLIS